MKYNIHRILGSVLYKKKKKNKARLLTPPLTLIVYPSLVKFVYEIMLTFCLFWNILKVKSICTYPRWWYVLAKHFVKNNNNTVKTKQQYSILLTICLANVLFIATTDPNKPITFAIILHLTYLGSGKTKLGIMSCLFTLQNYVMSVQVTKWKKYLLEFIKSGLSFINNELTS